VQYEEATSTSKKQRFHTPEIVELNKRKKLAVDAKEAQQKDLLRVVFSRFCAHSEKWQQGTSWMTLFCFPPGTTRS